MPNTNFVAVAGGGNHSLGLKSNGSIVAWGLNDRGQCDVPVPNAGFLAVAAGWDHSLGLKAGGSIVAWGDNSYNQLDLPTPNGGFVAIEAGGWHSLGIKGYPRADLDRDQDVDLEDFATLASCVKGPGATSPPLGCTLVQFDLSDMDGDRDVDLQDFAVTQRAFSGLR